MSSIIVVLNTKFTGLIAAHVNRKTVEMKKPDKSIVFLLVITHGCLTTIAVLTVHAETSLLYYTLQRSMQANININLW